MAQRGAIYVLTGERGSGKSLICTQIVADARARGLDVAGLLTGRSGPEPGDPRQVVDLRSGESRTFGAQERGDHTSSVSGVGALEAGTRAPRARADAVSNRSDPLTPGWDYAAEVFSWANEVLTHATPCDLLVVDEVGPLELLGGRGWVKALEVLRERDFRMALVVCRPELLDELEASLGDSPERVFRVDLENADELAATILEEMLR
jgi:nucleoside-triphosphatase THEP1